MAVIRALSEADLQGTYETLEPLAGTAYGGDRSVLCQHLAAVTAGDAAAVLTVDLTGQLLGVAVLLVPEPGTAELAVLWVAPSYRRRGLARAMLSTFTPVWADSTITVALPAGSDVDAASGLLRQFAFAPVPGEPRRWRTRRVRRTTGRASLAHLRT